LLSDEEDIVSSPSTASRELEGVAKQNLTLALGKLRFNKARFGLGLSAQSKLVPAIRQSGDTCKVKGIIRHYLALLSDEEDIVSSPSTASRELEGVAKQNLTLALQRGFRHFRFWRGVI
jgi:hypothetical protein